MGPQSRTGRFAQQYKRGGWPWKIRPADSGSGGTRTSTGTASCLGTSYTPVAERFVGTPSPLTGQGLPDLQGGTILIALSPVIVTANFNYSGTSTGYYSSGSYQMSLMLYKDANVVDYFSCGNGGLIANPIFYTYSREGANDMLNFDGKAYVLYGSANAVAIDLTVFRCSVSVSFKVLCSWTA